MGNLVGANLMSEIPEFGKTGFCDLGGYKVFIMGNHGTSQGD